MKHRKTTLVLPGDHLGDLPQGIEPTAAANFLACWTALWHPALLVQTGAVPGSTRADELMLRGPEEGELLVIPRISKHADLNQWCESLPEGAGSSLPPLEHTASRAEVIPQLAKSLGIELSLSSPHAGEFYALGYAFLQVEMLTRAMHYDGLLNHDNFTRNLVEGAQGAMAGDQEQLDHCLNNAYDQLVQARNHYYPIDCYLIDLALLAPEVMGPTLATTCNAHTAGSFLVTGELLREMAQRDPESLAALRRGLEENRLSICGGSDTQTPPSALGPEQLLEEIRRGVATCEELLGHRPTVFAHRHSPVAPLVPGVLYRMGYFATLLTNFCGEKLPYTMNARTSWSGLDGVFQEALNAPPLDAGNSTTLLELSSATGNAMDYEMAATLLLVGWPGHRCETYTDLRQVARRSSVLGQLIRLDDYFESTTSYDHSGPLAEDEYPDPPLGTPTSPPSDLWPSLASLAGAADAGPPPAALGKLLGADPAESSDPPGRLLINTSSLAGRGPAFGWRWQPLLGSEQRPSRAEGTTLRNELVEVVLDPDSGGISAARLHERRGNMLSQRLVLLPRPRRGYAVNPEYQLAIDSLEIVRDDDQRGGAIASLGRVVDREGTTCAKVRQVTSLAPHSTCCDIEVEVERVGATPHHFALASQLAFRDPDSKLRRGLQGITLATKRSQVVAPWLQIAGKPVAVALLCDQARLHHRHHERMIDTLLLDDPGEQARARVSYWIDAPYPAHAHRASTAPHELVELATGPPRQTEGWWLNLGARNVMTTHLAVEQHTSGELLRIRLLETEGRTADVRLATWRPIVEAQQVDFRGQAEQLLVIDQGEVILQLAPYEWIEIIAAW